MNEEEIIKKKPKCKPSLKKDGRTKTKKAFPTLAHIVLSNGSVVEVPKLPMNSSELTTYDHMRIALEYAALATSCLSRLGMYMTPRLADSHNMAPIRLNLEDLMNHLYYAIEGFPKEREDNLNTLL